MTPLDQSLAPASPPPQAEGGGGGGETLSHHGTGTKCPWTKMYQEKCHRSKCHQRKHTCPKRTLEKCTWTKCHQIIIQVVRLPKCHVLEISILLLVKLANVLLVNVQFVYIIGQIIIMICVIHQSSEESPHLQKVTFCPA